MLVAYLRHAVPSFVPFFYQPSVPNGTNESDQTDKKILLVAIVAIGGQHVHMNFGFENFIN